DAGRIARRLARQAAAVADDVVDDDRAGGARKESRTHLIAGTFDGEAEHVESAGDVGHRGGREGSHDHYAHICYLPDILTHRSPAIRPLQLSVPGCCAGEPQGSDPVTAANRWNQVLAECPLEIVRGGETPVGARGGVVHV